MKLAYSANAYMRFPVEEAIRRIADLGYTGIELMADTPHLWPEDVTPGQIEKVRRLLEDRGLAISNVNAFMMNKIGDKRQPYWHPSWIEPDLDYRRIRIEHTKHALTMARQLGAPHITTEPGGPISGESQRESAMQTFVEMLRPVLDHAEREGVKLLVEPEPGLLIENMPQWLDFRSRIASRMMGLNYDVGHFYCVSEPLARSIEALAPQIDHVHVEDIALTRVHHHLVPGDGAIDFEEVFAAFRKISYVGWVTVELYPFVDDPDTAGRRAREHISTILS
jgi:sugar phosphate isomerase/epimerase